MKITPKCSFCETLGLKPHCNKCHMTAQQGDVRTTPTAFFDTHLDFADMLRDICDEEHPTKYIAGDHYHFYNKAGILNELIYNGEGTDTDEDGVYSPCFTLPIDGILVHMNLDDTNIGGYNRSYVREVIIPQILTLLPDNIAQYLIPVRKLTVCPIPGRVNNLVETFEKAYPYSEVEIFGKNDLSYCGEGTQYEVFKKYNFDHLGFPPGEYWLRSVYIGDNESYCFTDSSGDRDEDFAGEYHKITIGLNFRYKS